MPWLCDAQAIRHAILRPEPQLKVTLPSMIPPNLPYGYAQQVRLLPDRSHSFGFWENAGLSQRNYRSPSIGQSCSSQDLRATSGNGHPDLQRSTWTLESVGAFQVLAFSRRPPWIRFRQDYNDRPQKGEHQTTRPLLVEMDDFSLVSS